MLDAETTMLSNQVALDEVLSRIGIGWFHLRLLLVCGLGFSSAAIEVVLTAFLFPELRQHWDLNEYQLGALPSLVGFGSITGELVWGFLADRYGRREVFMVTVCIVVVFGVASALSQSFRSLYILRFIVGFGYGGNIAVDFTMYSELLPTSGRGRMLFYISTFWPIGQCITSLLAWWVIPGLGWRAFLIACAIPSLVTAFLRPLIPESPRWLLLNGYAERATEVCRHIATFNGKRLEDVGLAPGAQVCLEDETFSVSGAGETKKEWHHWLQVVNLWDRSLWRTTLGCMLYVSGLGFAGYASTAFMPTFLEMKGITKMGVYASMTISSLCEFPGIILAAATGMYFGRLWPLFGAMLFISVSLLLFGTAEDHTWVVVCSCLSSCCVECGWALFHVYTPEVFPTEVRATAVGFVTAFGSIISMCAPFLVAWLLETGSSVHVSVFFASICAAGSVFSRCLLHIETMDRDLPDRAEQLGKTI
mmetsp:Transcript_48405/g.138301  ORF Transcript_48405/g.138301 Transcript_48405/m.138301 type:complete len:477 (+) Transcript_48405:75-1505(+)